MFGKIKNIEEVRDFNIKSVANVEGKGVRLGISQMLHSLMGFSSMDGYKVETENHTFHVLIDNGQSCCESWGYFSSEDDLNDFVGADLKEIHLTDTALNKQRIEEIDDYLNEDEIQFVDFVTSKGVFQLAVYNSHNGYYGHGIVVAKDSEILLNVTL